MNEHVILLKTLADPTRLKVFKLLLHEELCVCELQELLQISQPAVSQHLARLKTAELIRERRSGMWTFYAGDRQRLHGALGALTAFLEAEPATLPDLAGEMARRKSLNRAGNCK